MGIRFSCPNGHPLHVKQQLAGQVGVCPKCQARVAIPQPTSPQATPGNSQAPLPRAKPLGVPQADSVPHANTAPSAPPAPEPERGDTSTTDSWRLQTEIGEQFGPGDENLLTDWQQQGLLTDRAHLWREGWPEWRSVESVRAELPILSASLSAVPSEKASAASRYVARKRQVARRQMILTGLLLALVVAVAIVLVVVLKQKGPPQSGVIPRPDSSLKQTAVFAIMQIGKEVVPALRT